MMARVDYDRLEVGSWGGWVWQVHENQSYLGRAIIRLVRAETQSLSKCTEGEWQSLRENIRRYESILARLFSPDRFNYGQLGNTYPQLHIHAVPRYASTRRWQGVIFHDRRWGDNWSPTPRSPLNLAQTYELASWFRSEVNRET
jgi:diadenosine tetraphosphate (Ap4A) HIT family hydrolase